MTADLSHFLLARITEDEEAAQAAAGLTDGRWSQPDEWTSRAASAGMNRRQVEHLIRNDPARVLAESDAKRRIVGNYAGTMSALSLAMPDDPRRKVVEEIAESHLQDVKALALPYADHPEWREEWRP